MDIVQVIGVALIALVIIMTLKQNKPEFVIYVELIAGVIILSLCFDKITAVVNYVYEISNKIKLSNKFIGIMLKITGIAILAEFASSICIDAGEKAIASKIEIGSKVIIVTTSIPIISSLLEIVLKVLP
ncbi:MAG: stage III sporulation protein AD [Clostridia bacterium]|nr:stage III sporulation protein AD [Clostridia bacterium]